MLGGNLYEDQTFVDTVTFTNGANYTEIEYSLRIAATFYRGDKLLDYGMCIQIVIALRRISNAR